MHITQSIIAAIALERQLQLTGLELKATMQTGEPAFLWHSVDGLNYKCYRLSLEPTDTNLYLALKAQPGLGAQQRPIIANHWLYCECAGVIQQSHFTLKDDDVVYLDDEQHFTMRLSVVAVITPN
jgi:chloramphenicol O-acetyltransferase